MKTLVLISSDPETSPRPAEGVRIAAGVGTWKKTDIILAFVGPAVKCLTPWVDDFVDSENFEHYLPIVRDFAHPVLVDAGSPDWPGVKAETEYAFEEITGETLAARLGSFDNLIRF